MPDRRVTASDQLAPADLAKVIRTGTFRGTRILLVTFGFIAFVAMLPVVYSAIVEPERLGSTLRNVWQTPVVFLLLLGCFIFVSRRGARQQIASSPELAAEVTYEFGDEGFETQSQFASGRSTWQALHAVRESKEAFILYRSKATFHVVPKRFLHSPEEADTLREIIRSQMGNRAKLLKQQNSG